MSNKVTVKEFMNKPIAVTPETDVYSAIDLLLKNQISGLPVIDQENRVVGILSEKDCLNIFTHGTYHNLPAGKVEEFMSREVTTVDVHTDLFTIAEMFEKFPFRRFPVVEHKKLVGVISRRDVLRAIQKMHQGILE